MRNPNKSLTTVQRFLTILVLLTITLFLVVSGVDAALNHVSRSESQSSLTVYNEQGAVVLAYDGDLHAFKVDTKPAGILHRT